MHNMADRDTPDGSGKTGFRGELPPADRTTLGFQHLDVMIAIRTEGYDRSATGSAILDIKPLCPGLASGNVGHFPQAKDKVGCVEGILHAPAIEVSGDPVVRRLTSALMAAKCTDGRHAEIYVDAVRLAIVARLLCLQSETQRSARCAFDVIDGTAERQMRALQKWRLKRVLEYVDKRLAEKISLSDLANVAGLSRMHFAAQFRAAMNLRPHEYLLRRRIKRAEELLQKSTMTLVEISLTVGFQTQAHFTTVFKRFVGETPYQWRSANGVAIDLPGQFRPAA
jgi:AraC family transcriptional regulator